MRKNALITSKNTKEIYKMTIEIKKSEGEITIKVGGRLDTITAPVLEKTIGENIGDAQRLVLDFGELEYISSAGLRVLLSAQKRMSGRAMKLVGVCEEVMEILSMTGFADILEILEI